MNRFLMAFISLFFTAMPMSLSAAETAEQWLWATTESRTEARHLALTVTPMRPDIAAENVEFRCDIASDFGYRGAEVVLALRDEKDALVSEGALPIHISAGANVCTVTLDTSSLPLGSYTATFSIRHDLLLSEPSHVFTLRNVSRANLRDQLSAAADQWTSLETALDSMEGDRKSYPYLRLKLNLVADVLDTAREEAEKSAWESVEAQLRYATRRLYAVHAGMVFGDTAPERTAPLDLRTRENLRVQDGAFYDGTHPVFLFGGVLPTTDPAPLAQLERYQLNAATVTVEPNPNPAADSSLSGIRSELEALFDRAAATNLAVAVQLTPDTIAPVAEMSAPALDAGARGNFTDSASKAAWESYLEGLGPLLRDQPNLLGVSLARNPRFHFEGEAAKDGFLEFIRSHYPDRITLNRAWRSHLASLEDIKLWSQDPYDDYQTRRSYRFDWQTYHQSLGNAYLQWSRDRASAHFGDTPLMVTLPDTPFRPGESVYGVDREKLADIVDISACTGGINAQDPVYALNHPRQPAHYTLLRSFAPEKPVFNLHNTWEFPDHGANDEVFRFVHSALWEAVLSGLSGATVPMDSLVFQRPAALEGFATAALDVNRLAPIVMAFQAAPVDVGILFSESSRVFDNGDPHLKSALNAYEGASFGGYHVGFVTERQCHEGVPESVKILVIPDTPAINDKTFQQLSDYVEEGGTVARTGAPIPYNERGFSRDDLIRNTGNTVLVRGLNLPTEYLHAMDAATVLGALPQIPRTITAQGYPVEGVKSRFVEFDGKQYLYVVNLRKEPAYCTLTTATRSGRDLINGRDVTFPTNLEPLVPMLIELKPAKLEMTVTAAADPEQE